MKNKITQITPLFFLLFLFNTLARAENAFIIDDNFTESSLQKNLEIYEDTSGNLKIEDVSAATFSNKFLNAQDFKTNYGFSNSAFWIKTTLTNTTNKKISYIIEHPYRNTNFFDLYAFSKGDKRFKTIKSGLFRTLTERKNNLKNIIFKLNIEANSSTTLFFRQHSQTAININIRIWSPAEYQSYEITQASIISIFYGLCFLLLLVNIVLFFILKTKQNLYLAAVITFALFAFSFLDGLNFYLTTYFPPSWFLHISAITVGLALLSLLQFSKEVLNNYSNYPSLLKYHQSFYLLFFSLVLVEFLWNYSSAVYVLIIFAICTPIFMVVTLALNWHKNEPFYKTYFVAISFLLMGLFFQVLFRLGYISNIPFIEQAARIGFVLFLITMTISVIDIIRWLQKQEKKSLKALVQSQVRQRESEEKFYHIFQSSPASIIIAKIETGKVVEVNPSFEKMMGYPQKELLGKSTLDIHLWKNIADRDRIAKLLQSNDFGHEPKLELLKSSGSTIVVDSHFFKIKISGEMYTVSTFVDVTEKSRQESILKDITSTVASQEHFLENLILQLCKISNSDIGFIGLISDDDPNQINTYVISEDNQIIDNFSYKIAGSPCEATINNGFSIFPKELTKLFPDDQHIKDLKIESFIGAPLISSKGNTFGVLAVMNKAPMNSSIIQLEIIEILAARAASEIERSRSDLKFEKARQKLSLHIDQTPLAAIEWNKNFEVVKWNSAAEKIFGYSAKEAIGKSAKEIIIPDAFIPHVDGIWNDLLKNKGGQRSSNENVTKQGNTIFCEWYNTPLVTENGEVIGVASLAADKTTEHKAQQDLLIKQQEQSSILSSMIDGVLSMDTQGTILSCNEAAKRITLYSEDELVGLNITNLAPDSVTQNFKVAEDFVKYLASKHATKEAGPEVIGVKKDSKEFPIKLSIVQTTNPISKQIIYIGTFQDLSHSKKQEEQLRRSQKMDALGKLTGGIAHDFNNLLGVIIGYSDLLDKTIEPDTKQAKYSDQIHRAAERGAKLTQKLLGFSRAKRTETTVVNINTLLSSQVHLLEKTLTSRIKLQFEFDDNLWETNIDAGDFEDAILNLCINSMHAIDGTGQITIKTSNKVINQTDAQVMQIEAGEYALVQITDSGSGIDADVLERIFDPFFTTKGDEGTGLGLSQVYGFIKNSNGGLKVYSEINHGTQFNLYFKNHDTLPASKAENINNERLDLSGDETILVVDDEEPIRLMSEEILLQNGYKVLTAGSAEEALKVLKSNAIDLVLSDVIMPKIDGYEFAKMVQKEYPNVKIQLASGFTDDRQKNIKNELYYKQLLQKPYSAETLLITIRNLLNNDDKA